MKTLFERFLVTEGIEMLIELAGHAYNMKALCTVAGADYEENYLALVSKNMKPGEKPWRMTIYTQNPSPSSKSSVVHIQLDDEFSYLDNTGDGSWEKDVLEAVQEYINPDCISLESEPISRDQIMDMIAPHIQH